MTAYDRARAPSLNPPPQTVEAQHAEAIPPAATKRRQLRTTLPLRLSGNRRGGWRQGSALQRPCLSISLCVNGAAEDVISLSAKPRSRTQSRTPGTQDRALAFVGLQLI
jgi:hypothetical protein